MGASRYSRKTMKNCEKKKRMWSIIVSALLWYTLDAIIQTQTNRHSSQDERSWGNKNRDEEQK